ncbi:hypothetical protein [Ruminococcus sp. HUN007]|uniref:hypothetical protein n=1 Tax=Ruminococcus sp. HUN007 TaxID=1514668 RepID=UPI0005D25C77|nr:hypothetical protein [Ruminococcus sp. HUN007]
MSGISRGSIFFTPVVMTLSVMYAAEHIAKSAGRVAFAGVIAVHKYSKAVEEKKLNALNDELGSLGRDVTENMNNQREALYRSTEQMLKNINDMHTETVKSFGDSSAADDFRALLKASEKNTLDSIERIHTQFRKNYSEVINRSNSEISMRMTRLKESILSGIAEIEADIADRDERARERAASLIEDARTLLEGTESETAEKYIHEAESDLEKGNYQSAVSLASSAVTQIFMDMYRSDAEDNEREFYRVTLAYLLEEADGLLASLKEAEFKMPDETEREVTADLTQFIKSRYAELTGRYTKIREYTVSAGDDVPSSELKRKTEEMSSLIAEINEATADAFYCMFYSLNRVEAEKVIFGLLREKGFTLKETNYTDGDPSKSGERKYVCQLTGEELTISLLPYEDENAELQTELILASNKSSEENREQYRKAIVNELMGSCRNVADASLKCSEETRGMDAADTGRKTMIENPQPVKRV